MVKNSCKYFFCFLVFLIILVNSVSALEPEPTHLVDVTLGRFACGDSTGLSSSSFIELFNYLNNSESLEYWKLPKSLWSNIYDDPFYIGNISRFRFVEEEDKEVFISFTKDFWWITKDVSVSNGSLDLLRDKLNELNNLELRNIFKSIVIIKNHCNTTNSILYIKNLYNYDIDKLDCDFKDVNNVYCGDSLLYKRVMDNIGFSDYTEKVLRIREFDRLFILGRYGLSTNLDRLGNVIIISEDNFFSNGIFDNQNMINYILYLKDLIKIKDVLNNASKEARLINEYLVNTTDYIDDLFIERDEKTLERKLKEFKDKKKLYAPNIRDFREGYNKIKESEKDKEEFYVKFYEQIYKDYSVQYLSILQDLEKNLQNFELKIDQIAPFIAQEKQVSYSFWGIIIAVVGVLVPSFITLQVYSKSINHMIMTKTKRIKKIYL